jgi:hypothetical protein
MNTVQTQSEVSLIRNSNIGGLLFRKQEVQPDVPDDRRLPWSQDLPLSMAPA